MSGKLELSQLLSDKEQDNDGQYNSLGRDNSALHGVGIIAPDPETRNLNDNSPSPSKPSEMASNEIHPVIGGPPSEIVAGKSSVGSLTTEEFTDFSLHQAAREGALEVIKDLIASYETQGYDILRIIDTLDNEGNTPLHHAAKTNRKDVMDFLITIGAWLDVKGEDHNTPLHLAAK